MISVIIPYYNPDQNIATEKLLKRAIRSACDSLDGVATYEILIVNDGSHGDPVLDEFEDKPLIYIRREHNMLGAARNTGIENASGNLLTFLDADDFYYPGALALCIRKMEESGADLLGFGIKPTSCGSDICNIKSGTPSFRAYDRQRIYAPIQPVRKRLPLPDKRLTHKRAWTSVYGKFLYRR